MYPLAFFGMMDFQEARIAGYPASCLSHQLVIWVVGYSALEFAIWLVIRLFYYLTSLAIRLVGYPTSGLSG